MKKTIKSGLLISIMCLTFSCNNSENVSDNVAPTNSPANTTTSSDSKPKDVNMSTIMNDMMGDMHSVKMTGDTDYDFAAMMIPHHKGAVEMAKLEINSGKNQELKTMAQNIINSQEKEISQMQTFLDNHKLSKDDMSSPQAKEMMATMNMDMPPSTGDIDFDFVNLMIPHHQSAVDMANVQLKYGQDKGMRELAESIIKEQEKEIKIFKEWIEKNK